MILICSEKRHLANCFFLDPLQNHFRTSRTSSIMKIYTIAWGNKISLINSESSRFCSCKGRPLKFSFKNIDLHLFFIYVSATSYKLLQKIKYQIYVENKFLLFSLYLSLKGKTFVNFILWNNAPTLLTKKNVIYLSIYIYIPSSICNFFSKI